MKSKRELKVIPKQKRANNYMFYSFEEFEAIASVQCHKAISEGAVDTLLEQLEEEIEGIETSAPTKHQFRGKDENN